MGPYAGHVREGPRVARCKTDWFRVVATKLRSMAATANDRDFVSLAFDGEALRISACGRTFIVQAAGTAWKECYAIKATALDHLPKRLTNPVPVSIWEAKLTIGNRVWSLVDQDEKLGRLFTLTDDTYRLTRPHFTRCTC